MNGMLSSKGKKRALFISLALLLLVAVTAYGASYEKVYGETKDRIRVREKASLSAAITDNLRADSCVWILSSKSSGTATFVQIEYRSAEGKKIRGWAAQKSGGTTYIEILTAKEAQAQFGVSGGKLPSAPAGTMSKAEREERAAEKEDESKSSVSSPQEKAESDSDIAEAQEGLKTLDYYWGEVTGHAGSKTVAAIRAFQKDAGLPESGEADSGTLKAIRSALRKQAAASESKEKAEAKPASTPKPSSSGTLRIDSTGSAVRTLQKNLTTLGYYYGDVTGHYGEKTAVAVRKFQRDNKLSETGEATRATQRKIAAAASKAKSSATGGASRRTVYNLDWFAAKDAGVFPKIGFGAGKSATLQDLATRKTLQVRIQSSGYHLDVEPLTEKDTKALCSIYGVTKPKSISAERRPMLLTTVHGYRIVCSCYGTPHGTKMVYGNKFPGQFWLHFLNSKTSGSGVVDNGHQAAVRRAIGAVGSDRVVKLSKPEDLR